MITPLSQLSKELGLRSFRGGGGGMGESLVKGTKYFQGGKNRVLEINPSL